MIQEMCRKDFAIIVVKEETYWIQRSRISWLKDGDRNSKFFHKVASHHRIRMLLMAFGSMEGGLKIWARLERRQSYIT